MSKAEIKAFDHQWQARIKQIKREQKERDRVLSIHLHHRACPDCGGTGVARWTENGAPHGEGYWAMPMEGLCHCLESGHCPICYTHLMPRPWLHHLSEWCQKKSTRLEHTYHNFGVAIAPWRGNVRRKLLYHLSRWLTHQVYPLEALAGEHQSVCPLCQHRWQEEDTDA